MCSVHSSGVANKWQAVGGLHECVCVRERRYYSTFVWTHILALKVETKTVDRIGYVSSTA